MTSRQKRERGSRPLIMDSQTMHSGEKSKSRCTAEKSLIMDSRTMHPPSIVSRCGYCNPAPPFAIVVGYCRKGEPGSWGGWQHEKQFGSFQIFLPQMNCSWGKVLCTALKSNTESSVIFIFQSDIYLLNQCDVTCFREISLLL